jgi:solute:Na+ symporter, SSS family
VEYTIIYWAAFLAYCASVVSIGFYIWFKRKKGPPPADTQLFWSANKKVPGYLIGLSISASMMSISWSCVYGVQLFYWYGIGAAWLLAIPWLITMIGYFTFAPLFRKLNAFSQPELLGKRFGKNIRQLLAIPLIFVFIVWGGAEIYAAGITVAPFLHISPQLTMLLIAITIALYTYTGGFAAVVSTDRIQFAFVALFVIVISIIGVNAVKSHDATAQIFSATSIAPKVHPGYGGLFSPGIALIAMTFFAYLPGWLIETDVWIRLQAAADNKEARKGILIAGTNSFIFVGVLPMLIGLSALLLYPPVNGIVPERLHDGALIFTSIMQDFSPGWLNILLGIGLLAASMSTVDTCGNVVALSLSYDLLEPHLSERWTSAKLNKLAKWISVIAVFIAFFYGLIITSLWDIFYLSSGVLTTTVFIPVITSFLPNTNKRQVMLATTFGFVATIVFYFMEARGNLKIIEPGWLSSTGVGYIVLGFLCGLIGFLIGKKNNNSI